ncbi:MAG: hypothetical protein ACHQIH_04220 [Ignavibacteria bacterium]
MKQAYQILYGMSVLVFLFVLLGGSLTKPVFNNFSLRTLETAGVKKAAFDSLDSKIDGILYTVGKVQLQIEKLKNLFSDKEIDVSKYQMQKNEVFVKNIYTPINELIIFSLRIFFSFISIFLLLIALIIQLIYRSRDLRNRITAIENKLELDGV